MGVISEVQTITVQRLLDLYPVQSLRENWPGETSQTKAEITHAVADNKPEDEILEFAHQYFDCCKQHVYVFEHSLDSLDQIPEELCEVGPILRAGGARPERLYLLPQVYKLVLSEPETDELQRGRLKFYWPFKLAFAGSKLIATFVKLHKSIRSYFSDMEVVSSSRELTETHVIEELRYHVSQKGGLAVVDLHKGVKRLWHRDFIDSSKVQFRKAKSTSRETMDEDYMIKKTYPDVYEDIRSKPLDKTVFTIIDEDSSLQGVRFTVEPSKGFINFPTYSENAGDTSHVVQKIIRHNE